MPSSNNWLQWNGYYDGLLQCATNKQKKPYAITTKINHQFLNITRFQIAYGTDTFENFTKIHIHIYINTNCYELQNIL